MTSLSWKSTAASTSCLATAGDVCLGGIDWDRRIVDHVAEQFKTKHRGIDPRDDPGGTQRLLRESEDAKRALTARDQITISFEHGGLGVRVPLSRQQFEEMTADLLERHSFHRVQPREGGESRMVGNHVDLARGWIDADADGRPNARNRVGQDAGS